jgi:hypothetical protein
MTLSPAEIFSILSKPENADLLDFIQKFSLRLREANTQRVSLDSADSAGAAHPGHVSRGDRRLDAMARLLEGNEVCAAVAFNGKNLLISTNNDGHIMDPIHCALWGRIHHLHGHLIMIARMSLEAGRSIPKHDWLPTTREEFLLEALPFKLLSSKAKVTQAKLKFLQEFTKKLNQDFFKFESGREGAAALAAGEDIVEAWMGNLIPRVADLDLPDDILAKFIDYYDIAHYRENIIRFFQDLIKLEEFVSHIDHADPLASEMVRLLAGRKLGFQLVDAGGPKVHAEMRLTAKAIKEGNKYPYIGISKLCCAFCNVIMEHVLKVQYFEREDEGTEPSRGTHITPYPWTIHKDLLNSEVFLRGLLGDELYVAFQHLITQERAINPGSSLINMGDLVLYIIQDLPRMTFDPANRAQFVTLGIELPEGEAPLTADSSIAASKTPAYVYHSASFFMLDTKELITDTDPRFYELQERYKKEGSALRAFLAFTPMIDLNVDLWYTDEQVTGLLNHRLGIPRGDMAPTVFDNDDLLVNNINHAMGVVATAETRTAVMPIHLHGNHWVGAVLRAIRDADGNITGLNVFFNNPQGYTIQLEENAVRFAETIIARATELLHITNDNVHIIDLHLRQQNNGNDCGPFTVDNLVRLATAAGLDANGLTRDAVIDMAGLKTFVEHGAGAELRAGHNTVFTHLGLPIPTANVGDIDDEAEVDDDVASAPHGGAGGPSGPAASLTPSPLPSPIPEATVLPTVNHFNNYNITATSIVLEEFQIVGDTIDISSILKY